MTVPGSLVFTTGMSVEKELAGQGGVALNAGVLREFKSFKG